MLFIRPQKATWFNDKLLALSPRSKTVKNSLSTPVILPRQHYVELEIQLPKMSHVEAHKVIKGRLSALNPFQEKAAYLYTVISIEKGKLNLLLFLFPESIISEHIKRDAFIIPESLILYKTMKSGAMQIENAMGKYFVASHKGKFYSRLQQGMCRKMEPFLHSSGLPEDLTIHESIESDNWAPYLIKNIKKLPVKILSGLYINYTFTNAKRRRQFLFRASLALFLLFVSAMAYLFVLDMSINKQTLTLQAELKKRSKQMKRQLDLQDERAMRQLALKEFSALLKDFRPATRALIMINELVEKFNKAKITTVRTSDKYFFVNVEAKSSSEILAWLNARKTVENASLSRDLKTATNGLQNFEVKVLLKKVSNEH